MDGARFLASVAIVWLHVPREPAWDGSSAVGRFAVPFFTQAAVLLAFYTPERRPDLSLAHYAARRFRRIYPAFLTWSVFYAGVRWCSHTWLHQPSYHVRLIDLLWNGTALQLWFLPFILLATVLAFAVAGVLARWQPPAAGMGAVGLLAGLGFALPSVINRAASLGYTGELALAAAPSVCWAMALGAWRRQLPPSVWHGALVAVLGSALWVGGTAWVWRQGRQTLAENLAGLGCTLLVFHPVGVTCFRPWARWGFAAFGMYLLHPFWVEGLENMVHCFHPAPVPGLAVGAFVFASCLSLVSTCLLWRWRGTRWLVA